MVKEQRLGDIEFNVKKKLKRSKNLLDELDDLEDEVPLVSSISSKIEKEKEDKKKIKKALKEEKEKEKHEDLDDDDWAITLSHFKAPKAKKRKDFFNNFDPEKKGKKKKKHKGGPISHKKDFDPELVLLRNLQRDQDKFVDSLQKKYDQLESMKSSARGTGKFTTDLIMSINNGRSVSMQLVDKIISAKKTIADLDLKERKEFGNGNNESENMNNFASSFLKTVVNSGRGNLTEGDGSYENFDNQDYDTDDLFDDIESNLGETDRSPEVENYLEHEKDNVQVKVHYHDSVESGNEDDKYDFAAYNGKGERIYDYHLPQKNKLTLNRNTNLAKDLYGNTYEVIYD